MTVVTFDLKEIGRTMARSRYQRGTLRTFVPGRKGKPDKKLPKGTYWCMWKHYGKVDGEEKRLNREKILTRELAEQFGIAKDYTGPLLKTDAQRLLDQLIANDSGKAKAPNRSATLGSVALEYLALSEPNWGPHMVRSAGNLVRKHLVEGSLGNRPIAEIEEVHLQAFLNVYVNKGASVSLLKGLLLHIRAIFKFAKKRKLVQENPTEDLKAKSRKQVSERVLSLEECQRLLSVLFGRDRLMVRILIQLGLRPEELFALRRDDLIGEYLRVDEALVEGEVAPVKTPESKAMLYIPAGLQEELKMWLQTSKGEPSDWIFQPKHGRAGHMNQNNFRERVLQPAAIRANIGVIDTGKVKDGKPVLKTDVDMRCLRRTCATLFGARARDPKMTQSQMRHADPSITLRIYQKSVPDTMKAAASTLESDLMGGLNDGGGTVQ